MHLSERGNKLRQTLAALAGALLLPFLAHAQSLDIIWQASVNSDRVNTLQFTPDGTELITGSSDRLIHVFNANTGEVLQTLDSNAPDVHASSIECLAINPTNPNQIATVSSNIERIWDLSTGKETVLGQSYTIYNSWEVWAAYSPDGTYMATAEFTGDLRIWNITASGGPALTKISTGVQQRCCAFSPDGKWFASAGSGGDVTIRQITGDKPAEWPIYTVMTGHTNDVYDMFFSPDGTMLATGSYDYTARLWNVGSWTPKAVLQAIGPVYGVAFTADSKTLAFTDAAGEIENSSDFYLRLADTVSGTVFQSYYTPGIDIQCVAFSSQGLLGFGDVSQTTYVADVSGSKVGPVSPTVTITSPADNASFSPPATVALDASAASSNGVVSVQYFDGNGKSLGTATSAPYAETWSDLAAGSYTVTAVMKDGGGLTVTSAPISFTVSDEGSGGGETNGGGGQSGKGLLTLQTSGEGKISPPRPSNLIFNHKYTETAIPDAGYVFDGWTDDNGNLLTNTATYTFTMQEGLVLQANFILNPFKPVDGRYTGLIDSSPATAEGKGKINLTVAADGTFSGSMDFDFKTTVLSGKFAPNGAYSKTFSPNRAGAFTLSLMLDVSNGTQTVTGTVSNADLISSVLANRLVWNTRTNPAHAGSYNVLISADPSATGSPQGSGYARVTINTAGTVVATGHLADGEAFSETTYLSESNSWPFFVWGAGTDMASGFVTVETESTNSDMDGIVTWFRQANARAVNFSAGFASTNQLLGSVETPASAGSAPLALSASNTNNDNATVVLSGADFAAPLTFAGVLNHGRLVPDKSTGSPKGFNVTFNNNGVMQGTFVDPASGRLVSFSGIVYQDADYAAGYFVTGGQGGYIEVTPIQ